MSLAPGLRLGVSALTVLVFTASSLPASAYGQTSPHRVFVDATAATGSAVFDLKPEEFELLEGGERREITKVELTRRPARVILIVDNTEYLRQQIGQVRTALTDFVDALDPEHEIMLLTVAGTMQIRVRPTLDRKAVRDALGNMFGLSGANRMHKHIDDAFHRFAQTTDHRPIFVVITAEGFESTGEINPQEVKHIVDHFASRGGVQHAIRLNVPLTGQAFKQGNLTELPVSLLIARDTGGAHAFNSTSGLREALQRLAGIIDEVQAESAMSYRIEYASAPIKGTGGKGPPDQRKRSSAPDVRVTRQNITANVIFAPPETGDKK